MKKILWGFIGLWAGVSMLSAEPFVVVFKKQLNLVEMNRSWDEKHVSSEERTKELLRQAFQLQKAEKIRWEQFVSTQSWRGQVQTKHFFSSPMPFGWIFRTKRFLLYSAMLT